MVLTAQLPGPRSSFLSRKDELGDTGETQRKPTTTASTASRESDGETEAVSAAVECYFKNALFELELRLLSDESAADEDRTHDE